VAELHHEAWDGSGYPRGLRSSVIPLEARIVAAADVFDALASTRAYKACWSNDRAFARLRRLARRTLDPDCVRALVARREQVEQIQERFRDPDEWSGLAVAPA
jgi:HD-GYP domain-containing protein (c-di-GMP phosphodiesterase class II)